MKGILDINFKQFLFIFLTIVFVVIAKPFLLRGQEVGFMGINIGMSREDVLKYAESRTDFKVPKNRDVEFFPVEERKILTLSMEPEIPHMYLQFYNNRLYAITVIFDQRYVNYLTLCKKVEEKYGKYIYLEPDMRKWEINGIEIRVEKPATVKYIALEEFLKVTGFVPPSYGSPFDRVKTLLDGL